MNPFDDLPENDIDSAPRDFTEATALTVLTEFGKINNIHVGIPYYGSRSGDYGNTPLVPITLRYNYCGIAKILLKGKSVLKQLAPVLVYKNVTFVASIDEKKTLNTLKKLRRKFGQLPIFVAYSDELEPLLNLDNTHKANAFSSTSGYLVDKIIEKLKQDWPYGLRFPADA